MVEPRYFIETETKYELPPYYTIHENKFFSKYFIYEYDCIRTFKNCYKLDHSSIFDKMFYANFCYDENLHYYLLNTNFKPYMNYIESIFQNNKKFKYINYDENTFDLFFNENKTLVSDEIRLCMNSVSPIIYSESGGWALYNYANLKNGFAVRMINANAYAMLVNRDYCHLMWCFFQPYVDFMEHHRLLRKLCILFFHEQLSNTTYDEKCNYYESVFADDYVVFNILKFL